MIGSSVLSQTKGVGTNSAMTQGTAWHKPRPLDFDPSVYLRNDYVVIDFETTNLDHGSSANPGNKIVLACWSTGPSHPSTCSTSHGVARSGARSSQVQSHFGNEYEQARAAEDIRRASFVVAYNAKFELGWLLRCGLELRDLIIYDPMLGEYVLGGNIKPQDGLSLDATLRRYGLESKLCYVRALIDAGECPSKIERPELLEYCVRDVSSTEGVFLRQRQKLFDLELERVFYGRCLQSPMLADIENKGVQLDEARVRDYSKTIGGEYKRLDEELQQFCGGVNWRSPKQVAELLYTKLKFSELVDYRGQPVRTATGRPATGEETISALPATTDEQRKFRKLYGVLAPRKKQVSILESMRGACKDDGGLIRATFNQAVTQNHRLSSSGGKWGFQFQNFPRSFKGLFRAREKGWRVAEGDCPQLEFRVGIDLSNDTRGLGDILARADIHSLSSSVTGYARQEAKKHTFKPVYGGRSGTKRERAYYDAFRKRYHGLYDTQMGWVYSVLEHKSLKTATGLVFYWPDTEVTSSGYIINTPSIFNYPISSFATADISQLSLLLMWHGLRGMDSFIVNTVHDSGVLEICEEELDKVKDLMVQSYTEWIYDCLIRLYGYSFHTPLGVGWKCGEYWGEGKEEKYEPEHRFKFTSSEPTTISL